MTGHTVILNGLDTRAVARSLVDRAPNGFVLKISEPKRSTEQNAKLWAMLSDVSRAKPEGRKCTPETWKALFMHAHGFEQRFLTGLSGEPFPAGFRSSQLNKSQMADLITFIQAWGDERGVIWQDAAQGEGA